MPGTLDGRTPRRLLTVFGGTGYIGAEVVRQAQEQGFDVRVVTRSGTCAGSEIECVAMDLLQAVDEEPDTNNVGHNALDAVVRDATAVVNCISLWDAPSHDMERLHVRGATALASVCRHHDVPLVHLSGLGADPYSSDAYLRVRGQGDAAVYAANPNRNTVLRPGAIIWGTTRGLLPAFVMLAKMRVCPLFGLGDTMLQPVTLQDLAKAIVMSCSGEKGDTHTPLVDVVGNEVVSFRELLTDVARQMGISILPVPLPYPIWSVVASICAKLCSAPPITPAQVALMRSPTALRHAHGHAASAEAGKYGKGRLWQKLWGQQHIPSVLGSTSSQQLSLPTAVAMQEAFDITPEAIGNAISHAFRAKAQ